MAQVNDQLSTGLAGLDRVLKGLIPGDNVVWQVSSVDDYRPFVKPYCDSARDRGQRLIYFRFARDEPLVTEEPGATICRLHPEAGFEAFLTEIHKTIQQTGCGGYYVFDCLSDLAVDWYSDQMLGNFFRLTCPYLFDMEAIAYFAILRNIHSAQATRAIADTTQILLDVYRYQQRLYVHPIKVQQRYSPTMYMLHAWAGDDFPPVTESAVTSEVLTSTPRPGPDATTWHLGVWNRTFLQAEQAMEALRRGEATPQADEPFRWLLRMAISRDERVLRLLQQYLTLSDVLDVRKRMVGTGLIGGKAVGMLLARTILRKADSRWADVLEPHDSFYVGSDVFYTFLVQNGIWWVREKQKNPATFLEGAERARHRMLTGSFSQDILRQFEYMLDYFGQSPIIVRSSSLLEDDFGNSFAGKYESIFCANQGAKENRLEDFLSAVRTIYASAMSEQALRYRARRGLLDRDEQMALLIQRVSGTLNGKLFYPPIAGVGLSFNPYVWNPQIDPASGVLRLVLGLGTRAVNRLEDDYTRVVALNASQLRPETTPEEVRTYAQRKVDVLDLEANQLLSLRLGDVLRQSPAIPISLFASQDETGTPATTTGPGAGEPPWVLTFDRLFSQTTFVQDMREMLAALQTAYQYPVDIEFTANFDRDGRHKINLVQCRPLSVKEGLPVRDLPADLGPKDVILDARGAVIGQSRDILLDRIIYVVPSVYGKLPIRDRYTIARLIGRIGRPEASPKPQNVMLMGPGRWGTTTPSMGVPVSFADINTVSAICEIVAMTEDWAPDASLGTHFFNELIEMDILYLVLFPKREGNLLNDALLLNARNRLADAAPDAADWAHAVRVIDACDLPGGGPVILNADPLEKRAVCYLRTHAKNL
jgi:hypothetical protein